MATVKPFRGLRPPQNLVEKVESRPYDVLNSQEAREEAGDNEMSLYHIIKPEINFPEGTSEYDPRVYESAKEQFAKFQEKGWLVQDAEENYYLYAQTMNGKTQYGIVVCAAVEDYMNGVIKRHELTRKDKEEDRMKHVRTTNANMEPVFLAYPDDKELNELISRYAAQEPVYDFIAPIDGFGHKFWIISNGDDKKLITACGLFHDVGKLLIPDAILKKPGRLTKDEFDIIKTHPVKGYQLLQKNKLDPHIQYAALMHHEKCDGSGYPIGLKGNQIDWCAQIVTIADIYEAMTAKRVYRGPISPFKVINMFEEDGLKKYNPKYLLTFLEHVVNSYMNCKVRLSNGEEGDIVFINKVRLSKPMVKTKNNFIDLSKQTDINIDSIL